MTSQSPRSLVVEDEPSWQMILSEILNDSGLEVDISSSLSQAVGQLRNIPYRLAVVDLSLGGLDHHNQDGLRVLEAVHRYAPGCVAVMLTGYANVELAVSVIQEYGAYSCLRKENFRRAEFRALIHQALSIVPLSITPENRPSERRIRPTIKESQPSENLPPQPSLGLALVVEDDAGWRSLLADLLIEIGYSIHFSSSYGEALGLLKREQYQLVIADLSLASSLQPEKNLDGYRLLSNTHQALIPTIVVSGMADLDLIEEAYAVHGVFACLEKQSFDRSAFFQTVTGARTSIQNNPEYGILTEREREVLRLLAQGMTNKEIAASIYVTTNTVKRHLKSIFGKLGVNTRAAASARAIRLGIASGITPGRD